MRQFRGSRAARLPTIIGLIILLGTIPADAAPYLLGFWYGTGEPDDKNVMWLEQFSPNGDFRGQYRACVKGVAHDQILTGQWSLAGDMETISILTVDGTLAFRTDLYKFLSYDGRKWAYRYLPNGYVFSAVRVDGKFRLPDCQAVS